MGKRSALTDNELESRRAQDRAIYAANPERKRARRRKVEYDCLAKLEPHEPCFVLIGRDRASAAVIKIWAHLWLQEIALGLRPEEDRTQVSQALRIARDMEIWERDRRDRAEHQATEFNHEGYPTSGQHVRLAKNTTSGANDTNS